MHGLHLQYLQCFFFYLESWTIKHNIVFQVPLVCFRKEKKAVFKTSSYDCYFPFVSAAEKLLRSQSNVAPLYGFTIAGHSCYGTCTAMNCRLGHQMFKPGKQMPLIAHLSHPGSHLYHECLVYQMEGNSRVVNCTVR